MNKYYNPSEKKTENLFETLNPVYSVTYENPNFGNRGEYVSMVVEGKNEDEAKDNAMKNEEFSKHIFMKYFDKKHLKAEKPMGLYVIGKVNYYEGNSRA